MLMCFSLMMQASRSLYYKTITNLVKITRLKFFVWKCGDSRLLVEFNLAMTIKIIFPQAS